MVIFNSYAKLPESEGRVPYFYANLDRLTIYDMIVMFSVQPSVLGGNFEPYPK